MRRRNRNRLFVIAPLAFSALLAIGSYWLTRSPDDLSTPNADAPEMLGGQQLQPLAGDPKVAVTDRPVAVVGASHDATVGAN